MGPIVLSTSSSTPAPSSPTSSAGFVPFILETTGTTEKTGSVTHMLESTTTEGPTAGKRI